MKIKTLKQLSILTILTISSLSCFSQSGKVLDEIAAVVGDQIILKSYIEEQRVQMLRQRYFSDKDIRCEILEDQLYTKLLTSQADIDSIVVEERDIDAELARRIEYFTSELGSEQKVEEYFSKTILELKDEFRPIIKDQLLSYKMQQEITKDIAVTPAEVRKFFEELPTDSVPMLPATYELQQIVKYPKVDEKEVLAVMSQLEDFKKRISEGENFATLAVLYSADNSARRGGEIGYVGRGDLVPEFANVAFKLQKGEVSRIVKTEYGYHIIQMIDRRDEKINVRHILITPKIQSEEREATINTLDSIRNLITADTLKFEDAVAKFTDDNETRNGGGLIVNMRDGSVRFEQTQIDAEIASAIKDLPEGYITQPFEDRDASNKQNYKIVKIRRKIESHPANLTDDYTYIQNLALLKKQDEYVGKWVMDKKSSTYIRIDPSYNSCAEHFKYPWLQNE